MIEATDKNNKLIRKEYKATRSIDFSGLNRSSTMAKDSVYCSDIDGIMEFSNKYLIIFEIKEEGQWLRRGQKWLYERLINAWEDSAKPGKVKKGIVLFATHSPELGSSIPVGECNTQMAYTPATGWSEKKCNLIDCLQGIGDSWDIAKLKKQ